MHGSLFIGNCVRKFICVTSPGSGWALLHPKEGVLSLEDGASAAEEENAAAPTAGAAEAAGTTEAAEADKGSPTTAQR